MILAQRAFSALEVSRVSELELSIDRIVPMLLFYLKLHSLSSFVVFTLLSVPFTLSFINATIRHV